MTVAAPERCLVFEQSGRHFALALERVASVALDQATRPVPLAPRAVVGLTLHGGRLVTVIDTAVTLPAPTRPPAVHVAGDHTGGEAAAVDDDAPHLVLLSRPFSHLALRVGSRPRLEPRRPEHAVVDIGALVSQIEAAIASGNRA